MITSVSHHDCRHSAPTQQSKYQISNSFTDVTKWFIIFDFFACRERDADDGPDGDHKKYVYIFWRLSWCVCRLHKSIVLVLVGLANFFSNEKNGTTAATVWFVTEIDVANWLVNLVCASVTDSFFRTGLLSGFQVWLSAVFAFEVLFAGSAVKNRKRRGMPANGVTKSLCR